MRQIARDVLARHEPVLQPIEGRMAAAVLLLLYERDGAEHLLFQVRSQQVEFHKGEISLPGGARDPEDDSLFVTALRETHEEIGVHPAHVEIFGQLDDVPTRTGFLMSPFVGAIEPPGEYPFQCADIEVATLLEVPLPHLMSEQSVEWVSVASGPRHRAFRHEEHLIFGATARVVGQFVDLLGAEAGGAGAAR